VDAYAIDGSRHFRIVSSQDRVRIRSLPGNELGVANGSELRIYGGWPPKLLHKTHFHDTITGIEPVAPSTIAVATARWLADSTFSEGDPQLFLYDSRRSKVRARRSFGDRGSINAIRSTGDRIVVSLNFCHVDIDPKVGSLHFLDRDLADASQKPITLRGAAGLAVIGSHLAIAESSCVFYNMGALWDYDPQAMRMRKIDDERHGVFQGDGS
jgi:hypothetical protein